MTFKGCGFYVCHEAKHMGTQWGSNSLFTEGTILRNAVLIEETWKTYTFFVPTKKRVCFSPDTAFILRNIAKDSLFGDVYWYKKQSLES